MSDELEKINEIFRSQDERTNPAPQNEPAPETDQRTEEGGAGGECTDWCVSAGSASVEAETKSAPQTVLP